MKDFIEIFRWLFFIVAIIFLPLLSFYISGIVAGLTLINFLDGSLYIPASVVSFFTSITCVLSTNYFAPNFKNELTWSVYIFGCVLLFIITGFFLDGFFKEFKETLPMILSAIMPSFFLVVYLNKRITRNKKQQSAFNLLDENL